MARTAATARSTSSLPPAVSAASPSRRSGERWNSRLAELQSYRKAHGHADPPGGPGRHRHLHQWCARQREQLGHVRDGRPTTLTGEQVYELMEVGLNDVEDNGNDDDDDGDGDGDGPSGSNDSEAAAAAGSKETGRPREKGGSALSERQLDALKVMMGGTNDEVRQTLAKLAVSETLSESDKPRSAATLDGLGDSAREKKWWKRLEALRQFRDERGHSAVASTDDRALYHWLNRQRDQLQRAAGGGEAGASSSSDGRRAGSSPPRARNGVPMHRLIPNHAIIWSTDTPSKKRKRPDAGKEVTVASHRVAKRGGVPSPSSSSIGASNAGDGNSNPPNDDSAMMSRRDKKWYAKFTELKEWKAKHGTIDVPSREQPLYGWQLSMQRLLALHRAGRETPLKREWAQELEAIGLGEAMYVTVGGAGRKGDVAEVADDGDDDDESDSEDWAVRLQGLRQYKEKHGNCGLPFQYDPDPALGKWVERQRAKYIACRDGKEALSLTSLQIDALDVLDFAPDNSLPCIPSADKVWYHDFEALEAYHGAHGTVNVKAKEDGQLYDFVRRQRTKLSCLKNGIPSTLKDGWIVMLLGLDKDFFPPEKMNLTDEQAEDFKAVFVPNGESPSKRRKVHSNGKKSKSTSKSVDSRRTQIWREKLEELRSFKEENGHCGVAMEDDRELFYWLLGQKEQLKLSVEVGVALAPVPKIKEGKESGSNGARDEDAYSVREKKWFLKLKELQKFKADHRHCKVSAQQDRKLYHWLMRQREKMQLDEEGGLSGMKETWIAELEKLGVGPSKSKGKRGLKKWNNASSAPLEGATLLSKREQNWYNKLNELKQFKAKHGSIHVTAQVDQTLHSWCYRQKEQLALARQGKASSLNDSWIEQLEGVGL